MKKNKNLTIYLVIGVIVIVGIAYLYNSSSGSVDFRTSNLLYGLESEIAYSDICGAELVTYGQTGGLGRVSNGDCNTAKGFAGATLTYIKRIPGEVTENGKTQVYQVEKTSLYKDDQGMLYVCSDIKDNGYALLMYSPNIDVPLINVQTVPVSLNSETEGTC